MNNRAIAYEFLLRIILAILFVGGAIYIGSSIGKSFFRLTGSGLDSFIDFAYDVTNLENGQYKDISVDFDKGTAIIGFSKDAKQFECHKCLSTNVDPESEFPTAFFKKPQNEECKDSACICLCRKGLADDDVAEGVKSFSCEHLICRALNNLNIIDEYSAAGMLSDFINPYWKGGFVYGRNMGIELSNLASNYAKNTPRTIHLRAENYMNFISVCQEEKCFSEEDRKLIDEKITALREKEKDIRLKEEFDEFIDFLAQCQENTEKCDSRNFISGHNIYYLPTTSQDNGIYLVKQGLKPYIDGFISKKTQISLFEDEDRELGEGEIFESNSAAFISKDNKVILTG